MVNDMLRVTVYLPCTVVSIPRDFLKASLVQSEEIKQALGRVVRKLVNVNPGLFKYVFFTSNVWCSMRLLQFKTEGQTISTEHQTKKLQS